MSFLFTLTVTTCYKQCPPQKRHVKILILGTSEYGLRQKHTGMMHPQVKECQELLANTRSFKRQGWILPYRFQRESDPTDNAFLLFQATQFVALSYASSRKHTPPQYKPPSFLTQTEAVTSYLFPSLLPLSAYSNLFFTQQ